MRILVLGGVGWIGSIITRILAEHPEVDEVIIGDLAEAKAKKLITEIGSDKVNFQSVNVTDHKELVDAMKGMDCVSNATWYEFALHVTKAAIDAGVSLTDLGGMPDLTRKQLALDKEAKEGGILNLIGCGETPGISNLLAKWGADRMDSVDSIHIRDGEYGKDSLDWLQHSVRTSMDEMTKESTIYQNGRHVNIPPRSGSEIYKFPEPIGQMECFYVPFEEAVTLPLFLGKPVNTVEMKVTISPELVHNFDMLEMFGLTKAEPVTTRGGVTVPPIDVLISSVLRMKVPPRKGRTYSCIAVEMKGTLDGDKVQRSMSGLMEDVIKWNVDGEGYKTALPQALSAVMLAKGETKERGVLPPEACIDPVSFLEDLKKYGLKVRDSIKKI